MHQEVTPYSLEAEQAVIGTLLNTKAGLELIEGIINPKDFYRGDHRTIFTQILDLYRQNQPYDIITVVQRLKDKNFLQNVGGQEYIATLAHEYYSATNLEAYARIIRDQALLRELLGLSRHIEHRCFDTEGTPVQELMEDFEVKFTELTLSECCGKDSVVSARQALPGTLELIEKMIGSKGGITGYPTGWADLDAKTLGLHPGDMTVVAGRPSMGKTTFALNMIERVATHTGLPCLVFSMEMPKEQLMFKLLASLGSIDQGALRSGKMTDLDLKKLKETTIKLSKLPLHIDDRGLLTPSEIRSTARRMIRQHGNLGAIMIDYLQLIHTSGKQSELRAIEVAEISRSLKLLARELNVPIIVLSQLNRSLEQRPNKRPLMSDIRESGAIEQDADNILFIYRDEVYNEHSQDRGMAEIIIGKQRNGPIGTVKLAFQNNYSRFMSLSQDLLALYGA